MKKFEIHITIPRKERLHKTIALKVPYLLEDISLKKKSSKKKFKGNTLFRIHIEESGISSLCTSLSASIPIGFSKSTTGHFLFPLKGANANSIQEAFRQYIVWIIGHVLMGAQLSKEDTLLDEISCPIPYPEQEEFMREYGVTVNEYIPKIDGVDHNLTIVNSTRITYS